MLKLAGALAVLLALTTEEKIGVIAAVAVVGCKCLASFVAESGVVNVPYPANVMFAIR